MKQIFALVTLLIGINSFAQTTPDSRCNPNLALTCEARFLADGGDALVLHGQANFRFWDVQSRECLAKIVMSDSAAKDITIGVTSQKDLDRNIVVTSTMATQMVSGRPSYSNTNFEPSYIGDEVNLGLLNLVNPMIVNKKKIYSVMVSCQVH
jgi:hypothetical protein